MTISVMNGVWWAVIGVFAVGAIVIWRLGRSGKGDNQKFLTVFSVITLLYLFLYKSLLAMFTDFDFDVWNELPLQPCNLVALLAVPAILLKGRWGHILKCYCFYGGVIFAPVAFLMPVEGFSGVPVLSVNAIGFYGFHGMVLLLSISMATLKIYRPRYRDLPVAVTGLAVTGGIAHLINMILRSTVYSEANYFYTYGLEDNVIVEALRSVIPWDFVYMLPLLLVFLGLCALVTFVSSSLCGWGTYKNKNINGER